MNHLNYCICTKQDQSHQFVYKAKDKSSDSYEREKAKTCQLSPKATYIWYFELKNCVVAQEENTAVLRSVSFRLGTECLELSIFCTLEQRRVQKRVHYFCLGYAPSTASASLFLPWPHSFCPLNSSLPLVSLPLVCSCGCAQSCFIPMKRAVTGSVMTGSVRETLRGAAYYCCMFKALSTA